jgi:hypothetical protein
MYPLHRNQDQAVGMSVKNEVYSRIHGMCEFLSFKMDFVFEFTIAPALNYASLGPLGDLDEHIALHPESEIMTRPWLARIDQGEIKFSEELRTFSVGQRKFLSRCESCRTLTSNRTLFSSIKARFFPKQEYLP